MSSDNLAAYRGRRVAVTGGRGYLATRLTQLVGAAATKVLRVMRSSPESSDSGQPLASGKPATCIEDVWADLADERFWARMLPGVDFVFHFAAQTSAVRADADAMADLEANVRPMISLLEACRRGGQCPSIVFAGSATEVGIAATLPVDESVPDQPATIYDLHKLCAEHYLEHYARRGLLRGVTLRLANVFGPGPESSSADRGVLNRMIRDALAKKPLFVFGSGEFVRDYVYIDDVVRAFVAAGAWIDSVSARHYVIGSGQGFTLVQAANLVADRVALRTGTRVPVKHIDPPTPLHPIETRNFVANTIAFRNATGWQPEVSFTQGIDLTIEASLSRKIVS